MSFSPRVSVVIATRNRSKLVVEAATSILRQSERDFELIIVDDCSTDSTPEVLLGLSRTDTRVVTLRSEVQCGPGSARNLAVGRAHADYVAVLDDDDRAVPDRLAIQCAELDENASVDLVFSSVTWLTDRGEVEFPGIVLRGAFPEDPSDVFRLLLLESNKVPNSTIMARTRLLREFPYPSLTWGEDWLWVLQLAARGIRMRAISRPLVRVLRTGDHESLMGKRKSAFASQRVVLRTISDWMSKDQHRRFAHLFPRAHSNQLVREARSWGGVAGIVLCLRALSVSPSNPEARRTLLEFVGRAWRRLTGVR